MALGVSAFHTPAFPSVADVRYGDVVAGWLTDPPGALVQVLQPVRGTSEITSWLVGPAFDALVERFPERRDLVFVFDLSAMTARSAAARAILLNRVRSDGWRFSRAVVVPPLVTPPMYLQSMRFSFMVLRTVGIAAEFADSSAAAIERLGLRALQR